MTGPASYIYYNSISIRCDMRFAILIAACIALVARADVVWVDDPAACAIQAAVPGAYALLCSLGGSGVCNGTRLTVHAPENATCEGAARYFVDMHGRNDVRWRRSTTGGTDACGSATFEAESLGPRSLAALSLRYECASAKCNARDLVVAMSGVSTCKVAVAGPSCPSDGSPAIAMVALPNATACAGTTVRVAIDGAAERAAWDVGMGNLDSSSLSMSTAGHALEIAVHPLLPMPAPLGMRVVVRCANGSSLRVSVEGTCEPVAYTGWCALCPGNTACFEPAPWAAGAKLVLPTGAAVVYGDAAIHGPGAFPIPANA